MPWWPSWLSDPIAFSNSESDVVWRVSRLPPWPPSWILNWTMQQFWISMSLRCILSSFSSTWLIVWEEMWFEEFQDGSHLGHWNRWTLAILNFHNTPMPPIMFKLDQTYCLVADVIWRFSRWLPWWRPWTSERNHFSNSKTPLYPKAFHCFHSIQLTIREQITTEDFQDGWRRCWKFSRWLTWQPSWILERNDFSNS